MATKYMHKMANVTELKKAIKKRVENSKAVNYSIWTIGITTDPTGRKKQHNDPEYWKIWEADNLETAREVETYFLNEYPSDESKRMKDGTGGDMTENKTPYVYIF